MATARHSRMTRYKPGDAVLVDNRSPVGHCRTPWFLRGKRGEVASIHGAFHDPERLAYHKPGLPEQVLYKVRFLQREIWDDYSGDPGDHLEADIYEPWLSPLDSGQSR